MSNFLVGNLFSSLIGGAVGFFAGWLFGQQQTTENVAEDTETAYEETTISGILGFENPTRNHEFSVNSGEQVVIKLAQYTTAETNQNNLAFFAITDESNLHKSINELTPEELLGSGLSYGFLASKHADKDMVYERASDFEISEDKVFIPEENKTIGFLDEGAYSLKIQNMDDPVEYEIAIESIV